MNSFTLSLTIARKSLGTISGIFFFLFLQVVTTASFAQDGSQAIKSPTEHISTKEATQDGRLLSATAASVYPAEESGSLVSKMVQSSLLQNEWRTILIFSSLTFFAIGLQYVRIRTVTRLRGMLQMLVREKTQEITQQKKSIEVQADYIRQLTEQLASQDRELVKQNDKARQSERSRSTFLALISREVRTPLSGLMGSSSLLRRTSLNDEQREYVDTIRSCSDNLHAVINDVFDFSLIESGNVTLEKRDFNIRTAIEEVLEAFAAKAQEKDVDLLYQIDQQAPEQLVGDELRLKQVLTNLIGNVIKFTQGGEDILVDVKLLSLQKNDAELEIKIQDTGIGVPYNDAVAMFKVFSQIDYSITSKFGGTGLGLSNCENLVRMMGGSISMESNRGSGTSFSFSIKKAVSTRSRENYELCDLTGAEGMKILIVDNNPTSLQVLKHQLDQWKLITTTASSSLEAMKVLSGSRFDLTLIDYTLADFDGVHLAHSLRKNAPGLPVILMTTTGDIPGVVQDGIVTSVLPKPITLANLSRHVVHALSGKSKSGTLARADKEHLSSDFSREFPLQILVAEDNLVNQKLTERVLSKLGYKASVVGTGLEAMEAVKKRKYDLIFMDVQMPEMNGLDATRLIRALNIVQPAIIALTANALRGDREDCLAAGMDDYISKPLKLDELVTLIQKWARSRSEMHSSDIHNPAELAA